MFYVIIFIFSQNVQQNILSWLSFDLALWQKNMTTRNLHDKNAHFAITWTTFIYYSSKQFGQKCV